MDIGVRTIYFWVLNKRFKALKVADKNKRYLKKAGVYSNWNIGKITSSMNVIDLDEEKNK